jgi:hypothetical protein
MKRVGLLFLDPAVRDVFFICRVIGEKQALT